MYILVEALVLDLGGGTDFTTEVVELRTANATFADKLEAGDASNWKMRSTPDHG